MFKIKTQRYLIPILVFVMLGNINAQELTLFNIYAHEKPNKDTVAFISLSDCYPLSEHPDSLAIPDLSEKGIEEASQFEYIQLDSIFRKQFLSKTGVSEYDKVFIYSYSKNKLIFLSVHDLKVVAFLNPYRDQWDWPYNQGDYMIGFEVNIQLVSHFEPYFENTLVYVGKKSPFSLNQLIPITWKKVGLMDFPPSSTTYDTLYTGKCIVGEIYQFETANFNYFVKDWISFNDNLVAAKQLIIQSLKTNKIVCEKLFYSGESTSFAEINNQWTGKLFKNKPFVILGFTWESFGCQSILFIHSEQREISINCDNRH